MPRRRVNKALTKTQQRKKSISKSASIPSASRAHPARVSTATRFVHNALPELDIDEIDLEHDFLGQALARADPDFLDDRRLRSGRAK